MRVLVDENIPRMTVAALIALRHDVKDIRGTSIQGAADSDLWALAECRALCACASRTGRKSTIRDDGFERFSEAEWPNLLVVVRDTTMSTSRSGVERN